MEECEPKDGSDCFGLIVFAGGKDIVGSCPKTTCKFTAFFGFRLHRIDRANAALVMDKSGF